jgi:glycosyltransferase involved in cell wall biosynthesis
MAAALRILVAHHVPRARTGGMSRIMGFLHDRLARDGHAVEYLCAEDVPRPLRGRPARLSFPLLVLRRAAAAARRGRPYDLVNVHEPQSAAVAAFRALAGDPVVVVTSHGVERRAWELALEERRLGRDGPGLKSRLVYPLTSLWQSSLGLRRADHLFCLNEEDRHYLTRWLRRPAGDVTRIFPGADPLYARAAAGRDYGRCRRLLFPATWRKNKGVEDLVPAFAALAARHPGVTLTVLGGGVPEEVVRRAFPEPVRGRVQCVHVTSDAESAAAYASADLLVLPSLFEGTPLTLMEAMMSGLPVVTTATCGMKDVVRDGENGLLVPTRSPEAVAAAAERLLGDHALRERLGRSAREEALRKYTWDRVAEPVREAYERLCAEARGTGRARRPGHGVVVPPAGRAHPSPASRRGADSSAPLRLRLLLVSFVEDNQFTGMGKWAHQMARALKELGHEPTLWFASDFPVLKRLGRLSVLLFPLVLAARLLLARSRFDAFVVHEPGGLWYGALRRLFPFLPPLVVMCHNVESNCYRALARAAAVGLSDVPRGMRLKSRLFRHWQSDGAVMVGDHAVCLSEHDRDYLVGRLGRRPGRVTRLVNGVAAGQFWGRPGSRGRARVLFVGGWLDVKGRRVLPPLWSRVRSWLPDARLTVAGSGAPEAAVLSDFDPADRGCVRVLPLVTSEEEMAALFAGHDVFLMPSLSEGSPLALLEAMAAGLPVVASRVGGIPDAVTDGVEGLLFDPHDPAEGARQVCRLLSDPDEARRLGQAGQERARSLTWDSAARGLVSAVAAVTRRNRPWAAPSGIGVTVGQEEGAVS